MGNIKRQKIIKCKIFLNILAISLFQLIVRKHEERYCSNYDSK